jgi:hypothetical protein
MSDVHSRFAVSMLIDDKHSMGSWGRQWIFKQHPEPLFLNVPLIPVGFGKKPLQKLRLPMLCSYHWLGIGQSRQGLVTL